MNKIKVSLKPIASKINLPTVIKTAQLMNEASERIFIATQLGEILSVANGEISTFLDIRQRVIKLRRYDERGLIGMAFHPQFNNNGLFYLHFSLAGIQGAGALAQSYNPNPCEKSTLNHKWTNRETQFDHIDTVEEWIKPMNGQPSKLRTLLNIKRPFFNHNGVNSLNFSPENGRLVLTTGDGGSGYDPFNLSQDDMEIAGKIIEIDVNRNTNINNPPVVTRFNELPFAIQETLTVIAKGVRNIPGITYQKYYDNYIKYVGNVGQDLVESIFSFLYYQPIPITQLIHNYANKTNLKYEGYINLGWRGWEGDFPTAIKRECFDNPALNEEVIAFYNEAKDLSKNRLQPLISYYHNDPREDKFSGTALTGVQAYMGDDIALLKGNIVFIDLARKDQTKQQVNGVLAYTSMRKDCKLNDFTLIDVNYNYGNQSAYYVSLGTNTNQTKLYLGVYGSMNATELNQGTVFEIIPL